MDMELERFKTELNLSDFAAARGYEIDRKESSRSSLVMRRGSDKIIIATDKDGHGIYFSVRDDADHGSIIDFLQRRHGLNLGQVRKELRPWLTATPFSYRPPQGEIRKPEPTTRDRQQVVRAWLAMELAPDHPYLIRERGLSSRILVDPRFSGLVKIDKFGNAVFPHHDEAGICGFELKNRNFTGFSKGGVKGVWRSVNIEVARRIVIAESAIDCMSHAQLFPELEAAYVSIGGSMSGSQRELLCALFSRVGLVEIVIATDNDEGGERLAEELAHLAPVCWREVPTCKDWNEQLKGIHKAA